MISVPRAQHTEEKRAVRDEGRRLQVKGKHAAASALAAACVGLNAAALTASPLTAWASTTDSSTFSTELTTRKVQGGGNVPATLTSSGPDEVFDRNSKDAYRKAPLKQDFSWNRFKRGLNQWYNNPKFARDMTQYAIIAAVLWRIKAAGKPDQTAMKLGVWDKETSKALVGTRWKLTLDVGREKGTWMPPTWAASGRRIEIPLAIEFQEDGVVKPIGVGSYVKLSVENGKWNIQGDTLRLNLNISGFERGDITLPEGTLYFKTYAWGNMMSSNKGRMLVRARRNVIRLEWRTVGSFKAEQVERDEVEYDLNTGVKMPLGAARVKEGDVLFPVEL